MNVRCYCLQHGRRQRLAKHSATSSILKGSIISEPTNLRHVLPQPLQVRLELLPVGGAHGGSGTLPRHRLAVHRYQPAQHLRRFRGCVGCLAGLQFEAQLQDLQQMETKWVEIQIYTSTCYKSRGSCSEAPGPARNRCTRLDTDVQSRFRTLSIQTIDADRCYHPKAGVGVMYCTSKWRQRP